MKNKVLGIVLLIGSILTAYFSLYQYLKFSQYSQYQMDESKIANSSLFTWGIDSWEQRYDVLEVEGWIVYKGENIETWKLSMIIQNSNNCYIVPLVMRGREDVTEKLNDGVNYDYSGFSATVNRRYIENGNTRYYILYENNGRDMIVDINGSIGGE